MGKKNGANHRSKFRDVFFGGVPMSSFLICGDETASTSFGGNFFDPLPQMRSL